MKGVKNPLLGVPARVTRIEDLTEIEKLLELELLDEDFSKGLDYVPGQFFVVGVMGVGEVPISTCTAKGEEETLEICVRRVGRVTNAIHRLGEGDTAWVRGPYGNGFPMNEMEGGDLMLVAGGIGIAPLRGVLQYALMNRGSFGEVTALYGVRCYDMMLFREEFIDLFRNGDENGVNFYLSYEDKDDDRCNQLECERSDRCTHGMVTSLFSLLDEVSDETHAVVCGPPIMYRFVVKELLGRGIPPERIYMTLERRMKCGVGKCGHCIIASGGSVRYVCKDGPVFTYWDALNMKGMI